ncbi:hypothetical protein MAPG_07446 [Magnaporthiopsis poae ATCC 64411]|uniref:Uncharacterized protein n=1 Tax=Magnaporthiopsis poae (strain ATCC 64411 / 73-15) TaxID=644358 RepID=A0A0C4E4P7_MAGP6|nr:hypothetical protein MAPG_07446 [Magnaporthiopsis poae ATCC 64411]
MLFLSRIGAATSRVLPPSRTFCRATSYLHNAPHIRVFPDDNNPGSHILTLLDRNPPMRDLAIGTTTAFPPTPQSFSENPRFMPILNAVLAQNAHLDEDLRAQAKAFVAPMASGGSSSGSSGWVHLSDTRNPPDFGRIAWPEDIFGSVEVDNQGNPMDNFQPSGTYRIVTNEGILGLSRFLLEKLTQRLREEEAKAK